jgi:hypothetical protein
MKNICSLQQKETTLCNKSLPLRKRSLWVMLILMCWGLASNSWAAGDRHPQSNIAIPPQAFIDSEYAGNVYDVTDPPEDLVIADPQDDHHIADPGDNHKDDTQALILAMDYVLDKIVKENNCTGDDGCSVTAADPGGSAAEYVIYLPNGTYNVNDTIVYSHALRVLRYNAGTQHGTLETVTDGNQPLFTSEVFAKMRFVGQSREGVTIKLRNQSAGFNDPNNPKSVVSFGKGNFNNLVAHNAFKNITIDTGNGNRGAIGLNFSGANSAVVQNVTVRSGGNGAIGIKQSIGATSGFMTDVTVEGFNTGVWIENFTAQQLVLEHATFTGQADEAIRIYDSVGIFRKILSENSAPFMRIESEDAHVVLLDSVIRDGSVNNDAIDTVHDEVSSLVRNVRFSGYGMAIDYPGNAKDHSTGYIDEYVSSPVAVTELRNTHAKATVRLPIEDAPVLPGDYSIYDASDWVCPEDMLTESERNAAIDNPYYNWRNMIQRAVNTGKRVLYFPRQEYRVVGSVSIPSSLHRIEGFYASLTEAGVKFLVNEESTNPLVIENITAGGKLIQQYSSRTIVLQQATGKANSYMNAGTGNRPKLFAYSVTRLGKDPQALRNMDIWGRMINTEFKTDDVFPVSEDARMWVLGFKTEGSVTTFSANNATIEVLGGIVNNWGRGQEDTGNEITNAVVENINGHISFNAATTRAETNLDNYQNIVSETVGSENIILNLETDGFFPDRLWDNNGTQKNFRIPLYAGYEQGMISALNRSILNNGNFESGLSTWQAHNGGSGGVVTDTVQSGNQAALVNITRPNEGIERDITEDVAAAGPGIYEAIAWMRGNEGPNQIELVLEWEGSISGPQSRQINRRQTLNSSWKKLTSAPFVIDWKGELIDAKFIVRADANNRDFYVDNCVLERQSINLEIIEDGGFEDGVGDWEAFGPGSLSVVDSESLEGNHSLQSPSGPPFTTGMSLDVTDAILRHGKGIYDISVSMKAAPGYNANQVMLEIAIIDAEGEERVIPIQQRQAHNEQWRSLSGIATFDWVGELQSANIRIKKASNNRNFIVDETTLVRR